MSSSNPNYLPEAPLPSSITLGIGFQHLAFVGTCSQSRNSGALTPSLVFLFLLYGLQLLPTHLDNKKVYSCQGGAVSRARLTWTEFYVAHESKKGSDDGSESLPGAG